MGWLQLNATTEVDSKLNWGDYYGLTNFGKAAELNEIPN
jgi:hypothetical protein